MVVKNVNIQQRYHPVPIAFLINTANSFICDIFIECNQRKVNVKNYEDMKNRLVTSQGENLLFYFNGVDESDAENRIEKIFQP